MKPGFVQEHLPRLLRSVYAASIMEAGAPLRQVQHRRGIFNTQGDMQPFPIHVAPGGIGSARPCLHLLHTKRE